MATKKRSSNVHDLATRVLVQIRDELRRGFAAVDDRFVEVNARFGEVNARLDSLGTRLDNLRDVAGDRYRDLDARVRVLESRTPH